MEATPTSPKQNDGAAEVTGQDRFKLSEALVLVLSIIVACGGLLYYGYAGRSSDGLWSSDAMIPGEEVATLSGSFYYTIGPGASNIAYDGAYYRHLTTGEKGPFSFLEQETMFYPAVAGEVVAALFTNAEGGSDIKVLDRSRGGTLFGRPMAGAHVEFLALAPDHSHVAYTLSPFSAVGGPDQQIDAWRLYLASLEKGNIGVFQGISPAFSSDGNHLFYVGSDGIYRAELSSTTPTAKRVWSIADGDALDASARLSAAVDVPLIAFTDPEASGGQGSVKVFQVDESGMVAEVLNIDQSANEIALSPDGKYIALQIRRSPDGDLPGGGEVIVYTMGGKIVGTFPLKGYAPKLQLTAWVKE